jgi:imidazolonepropionase-like amidohydrolase
MLYQSKQRRMNLRKLLFTLVYITSLTPLVAQTKPIVIKAGKLIDVISGKVLTNQIILIDGDTIAAVGAKIEIPANAEVFDFSNYTILPGLIDCHTHLTAEPSGDYYADIFRTTSIDVAVKAHVYTKRTLQAGFTTCRDVGAGDLIDVSLRNAINAGIIEGPRMLVACFPLGATGGHTDLCGFNPNITFRGNEDFTSVADGVDEIRKRVRNNVKWGADVIKFCATAGVLSEEESVGAPQYSAEEMKALVDEAHMWGKKVAAHAHGTEGIKRAVLAGVNSIEHCSILDDEAIKLMQENGTYMVPTMFALDYIIDMYASKGFPEKTITKAKSISKQKEEGLVNAIKGGVKIAYGTDAGVMPHGLNAKDFVYLVKSGMSPMEAIQTATVNAAELLGISTHAGSITTGKYADLIAVEKNPLDDISILENVKFVMKDGIVYKNTFKK